MREELRIKRLQALKEKPHQGKAIDCVSASPLSNHFIANGDYTSFAEWRFIHRARLGLVPLNGYSRE